MAGGHAQILSDQVATLLEADQAPFDRGKRRGGGAPGPHESCRQTLIASSLLVLDAEVLLLTNRTAK